MSFARAALVAMMAISASVSAQVTITADAALNSQYQWRGLTLTNRPILQPDLIVNVPAGRLTVTAGAFASIEGGRYDNAERHISENGGERAGLAEYDLWLESSASAGRISFTAGATTYSYPNQRGLTSAFNTLEAYVKAKADVPLAPSVAFWQDVQKVQGGYAEVSFSQTVGRFTLGALTGWNVGQSVGDGGALGNFSRKGFTHADLSLGTSWTGAAVTVAPSVHLILGSDPLTLTDAPSHEARAKVWFGSTLTWSHVARRRSSANGDAAAAAATGTAK
jgi:hypothetical protein